LVLKTSIFRSENSDSADFGRLLRGNEEAFWGKLKQMVYLQYLGYHHPRLMEFALGAFNL